MTIKMSLIITIIMKFLPFAQICVKLLNFFSDKYISVPIRRRLKNRSND